MAAIGASRALRRILRAREKMGMSFSKLRAHAPPRRSLLALLPLVAGCGGAAGGGSDGPTIVATTTQLADMARNIAPGAQVTALLSPNTDPHEYEVRPDDVKALASADIVLRSGGEVDEWLDGALDSAGVDEQDVVDAGAAAGMEGDDPHWWQDPRARREGGGRDRRARSPRPGCRTARRAYVAAPAARSTRRAGVHGPRAGGAAQARHQPRRARLLRAALRDRGRSAP